MAAAIPPALKTADIARFAQRAGQLEKAEPVVAYWCDYWILEQIIGKCLHRKDDDSKSYALTLMDKLEQAKADYRDNDAILDGMAGQAYVEQFALKTFQRAENAMRANKASRQTADTFQAAATFLDLLQIWGSIDAEVATKIRYSKYHALRIAKAIKAGEDPNLPNPAPETEPGPLDPDDPEFQMLGGTDASSHGANIARQPSVQEISDEEQHFQNDFAQQPSMPPQPILERQSQGPREDDYRASSNAEVSPLAPPSNGQTASQGGGYFPEVPKTEYSLPGAPAEIGLPNVSSLPRPSSSGPPSQPPIDSLHSFPPPNMDDPVGSPPAPTHAETHPNILQPNQGPLYPPQGLTAPRPVPQTPVQPPLPTPSAPVRHTTVPRAMAPPLIAQPNFVADEEAILKAQKHARWAISALNFEDVNTAVKELRGALQSLGAT